MELFPIQPQPIKIPEDNPFQYDLLDRQEAVETLTRLVGSIKGPCVLAVDAPWGAGKTTFLKIWAQYLRNQQFPVVEFNAWQTDFSDDPFVALCAELTKGVSEEVGGGDADEFKKAAVEVIKHIGSNAVEKMTGGLVVPEKLSAKLKKKAVETATEERLANHQQAQAVIEEFKEKLEDLARARNDGTTQADNNGQNPLVVMIDELDRCRPSYAVELLETAKHLFDVEQIVFVLAVNREQLAHAVGALYGAGFNAKGYLRRFFDVDIRLSEPNRDKFINRLFVSIVRKEDYWFQKLLMAFFSASHFTLRDIEQAVHRFKLVLDTVSDTRHTIVGMTLVALILRTLNEDLYHRFAQGEVFDIELADNIFDIPSITGLRWTKQGIWLQTGIWLAYKELLRSDKTTQLEGKIRQRIEGEKDEKIKEALQHAQSQATQVLGDMYVQTPIFRSAYRHVELSFSLIDETSA